MTQIGGVRDWDAVVVGGGPAGALAALELARRGVTTLLVERARLPRDKVCGGCVNLHALRTLEQAGLGDLPARLGAVPLKEVHLVAAGRRAVLPLPGGVVLSRARLDGALVEAAREAGVEVRDGTTARHESVDRIGRSLRLETPAGVERATARVVLDAGGLGSRFGDEGVAAEVEDGARIGAGTVVDARGLAETPPGRVTLAVGEPGYVGLARLEDGRLDVACALDPAAVGEAGGPAAVALAVLRANGLPEPDELNAAEWRGTPRLSRRARALAARRLLVLGDAAGFVEPFTGQGIAWALASGRAVAPLAARAAQAWTETLAREWEQVWKREVAVSQGDCRLLTQLLRRPALVRSAVGLFSHVPALARPLVRRVTRPVAAPGPGSEAAHP